MSTYCSFCIARFSGEGLVSPCLRGFLAFETRCYLFYEIPTSLIPVPCRFLHKPLPNQSHCSTHPLHTCLIGTMATVEMRTAGCSALPYPTVGNSGNVSNTFALNRQSSTLLKSSQLCRGGALAIGSYRSQMIRDPSMTCRHQPPSSIHVVLARRPREPLSRLQQPISPPPASLVNDI